MLPKVVTMVPFNATMLVERLGSLALAVKKKVAAISDDEALIVLTGTREVLMFVTTVSTYFVTEVTKIVEVTCTETMEVL